MPTWPEGSLDGAFDNSGRKSRPRQRSIPTGATLSFDDLDGLDRGILRFLQADGRANNAQMARELGTSEPTVRKRISRMLENHLMKVTAILNPHAHGFACDVLIGLGCSPGSAEAIADTVSSVQNVLYIGHLTGRYDLLLEILFHDDSDLYEFLSKELYVLPGVESVEIMHVIKAGRVDFDWRNSMIRVDQ
jgi:Lrp/AsnC family transcriptional regulator for asnA, asnC and gidA